MPTLPAAAVRARASQALMAGQQRTQSPPSLHTHPQHCFLRQVENGKGPMPAWEGRLSDEEIKVRASSWHRQRRSVPCHTRTGARRPVQARRTLARLPMPSLARPPPQAVAAWVFNQADKDLW